MTEPARPRGRPAHQVEFVAVGEVTDESRRRGERAVVDFFEQVVLSGLRAGELVEVETDAEILVVAPREVPAVLAAHPGAVLVSPDESVVLARREAARRAEKPAPPVGGQKGDSGSEYREYLLRELERIG